MIEEYKSFNDENIDSVGGKIRQQDKFKRAWADKYAGVITLQFMQYDISTKEVIISCS